jgi:hypothetical protein
MQSSLVGLVTCVDDERMAALYFRSVRVRCDMGRALLSILSYTQVDGYQRGLQWIPNTSVLLSIIPSSNSMWAERRPMHGDRAVPQFEREQGRTSAEYARVMMISKPTTGNRWQRAHFGRAIRSKYTLLMVRTACVYLNSADCCGTLEL